VIRRNGSVTPFDWQSVEPVHMIEAVPADRWHDQTSGAHK
jgi:hypothetical protein